MKKRLIFIVVCIMVLSLIPGGCRKKSATLTPQELGSDKEIYEKARTKMKRDAEKARLLFKEVMHLYPDSIYARRAKIGIADSYFRQKDSGSLIMAASEYQEYVNLYPNSPDAVYALFQVALCYTKQIKKPGRDQSNTHQAIKALENMIRQYPDTQEAEKAKTEMEKARLRLAQHYFGIGRTNYKIKAFAGAVERFKQVMDDYPEFKEMDKLFFLTGKSYLALGVYDTALSFFQKIVNSYPKSKFLEKTIPLIKKTAALQAQLEEKKKLEESAKK